VLGKVYNDAHCKRERVLGAYDKTELLSKIQRGGLKQFFLSFNGRSTKN
jgi:hypothetical protein